LWNRVRECRYSPALDLLAQHLLSFCERSEGITCLDASKPFLDEQESAIVAENMPDALHPSAAGEDGMDRLRAAYIAELLKAHK
jgi:lysophospholipase L1-like esterase